MKGVSFAFIQRRPYRPVGPIRGAGLAGRARSDRQRFLEKMGLKVELLPALERLEEGRIQARQGDYSVAAMPTARPAPFTLLGKYRSDSGNLYARFLGVKNDKLLLLPWRKEFSDQDGQTLLVHQRSGRVYIRRPDRGRDADIETSRPGRGRAADMHVNRPGRGRSRGRGDVER